MFPSVPIAAIPAIMAVSVVTLLLRSRLMLRLRPLCLWRRLVLLLGRRSLPPLRLRRSLTHLVLRSGLALRLRLPAETRRCRPL